MKEAVWKISAQSEQLSALVVKGLRVSFYDDDISPFLLGLFQYSLTALIQGNYANNDKLYIWNMNIQYENVCTWDIKELSYRVKKISVDSVYLEETLN